MKLTGPLALSAVATMRGVVDFYYWKGLLVARSWPHYTPRPFSTGQLTSQNNMRLMHSILQTMAPEWHELFQRQPLPLGRTDEDLKRKYVMWQIYGGKRTPLPSPTPGLPMHCAPNPYKRSVILCVLAAGEMNHPPVIKALNQKKDPTTGLYTLEVFYKPREDTDPMVWRWEYTTATPAEKPTTWFQLKKKRLRDGATGTIPLPSHELWHRATTLSVNEPKLNITLQTMSTVPVTWIWPMKIQE